MNTTIVKIDGSMGEGGGQILRSSLTLSVLTGKPFQMKNIRAGRSKPGLLRQHLTALRAAAEISNAAVKGDEIGSNEILFHPQEVEGGEYTFSIGSAGSTTLVCHTVLLPLALSGKESTVVFEGGTHNPHSPPYDFLSKAYLPVLRKMGLHIETKLIRPGFYPAGGGAFEMKISPAEELSPLELTERGEIQQRFAKATVSNLSIDIAKRELSAVCSVLGWEKECTHAHLEKDAIGPGNVLTIEVHSENITEVFTGFGEKGKNAEQIGKRSAHKVKEYLEADVPVGEYLADQLLIPFALAGSGVFVSTAPSSHTVTNTEVIKRFLERELSISKQQGEKYEYRFDS